MNHKILILSSLLGMFKGDQKDYDIPVNAEGMKAVHARSRKARAGEQLSKRKLKKLKGKKQ